MFSSDLCVIFLFADSMQCLFNLLTNPVIIHMHVLRVHTHVCAGLELRFVNLGAIALWVTGKSVGVREPWERGEKSSKHGRLGPTMFKGGQG